MSDAGWFYALGDEEKGPVSSAELKSLASSGQLKPADLVWKEGMGDWTPASEVKGLFPKQAAAPPPEPGPAPPSPPDQRSSTPAAPAMLSSPLDKVGSQHASGRWRGGASRGGGGLDIFQYGRFVGQPMLLVGLFLVLFSRGCDSVGNRGIARLDGKLDQKQAELMDLDANDRDEREDIQDDIEDLRRDRTKAVSSNRIWGYWRAWLFMLGTIVLSVGLLAVGFTSDGAARWICLIMLAIITFSVYVGGLAFIDSIQVPGMR